MSGFVVGVGNPKSEIVLDMLKKMKHRGHHFSGIHENDSVIMAQNYLRADLDVPEISGKIPVTIDGRIRLCYDGQLGNNMTKPAKNRKGFSEEYYLMNLYKEKGQQMLPSLNDAIFAFALYDGNNLLVARDLLGIKTLFFGWKDGTLYIASELKSLTAHMEDIHEFPPGCYMDESGRLTRYTELPFQTPADLIDDLDESTREIRRIIKKNIRTRVSFSRPTAALLSGGMDSSVICLLSSEYMREEFGANACIKTFAIGVGESQDVLNARLMANRINSVHREVIVSPGQVLRALPDVIYYLESFDPSLVRSSVANYLVSQAAKEEGIEVLLSGEGGDELFCGYTYLKQFPPEELFRRQMECLGFLHNNASLRLDRMNQVHSIKVVAPLVSGELLKYVMRIPARHKLMPNGANKTEKWIFRKAFESLLPAEITWRKKQEFSQGSGSAALLSSIFEEHVEEREFKKAQKEFPFLRSKEELFYFRIFAKNYGKGCAIETVGQWLTL